VIINKYKGQDSIPFYHIDLYRIEQIQDLEDLGLEDLFQEKAVFVVEWAERIEQILPERTIRIFLDFISENERKIRVQK